MRTTLLLLALASAAVAQEWIPLDGRSKAVGNAGVAFAEGPAAAYWNPASLAYKAEKPFDFSTGVGFTISAFGDVAIEGDILADVVHVTDLYSDLNFQAIQTRMNAGTHTSQDVQDALKIMNAVLALDDPGKGSIAHAGGGFDLKIGPFGIFARALGTVAMDPFYDFSPGNSSSLTSTDLATFFGQMPDGAVALSGAGSALAAKLFSCGLTGNSDGGVATDAEELAFQAQTALGDAAISDPKMQEALCAVAQATLAGAGGAASNTLYFNGSGVEIRSILQREIGISFGLPLYPSILNVGIGLKEIITDSFYRRITLKEIDEDDDLLGRVKDEYKENSKRSNDFNIDLGATVYPLSWLTVGLSARNLIPMTIDIAGPGGDIHLDPQVRMGAAARVSILRFGFDLDLTKDDSELLQGYESQTLGFGMEIDLWVLQLRGGWFDNIASSTSKGVFTGGLGLNFYLFKLDIAGQLALSEVKVKPADPAAGDNEQLVPERLGVGVTLRVDLPF